MRDNPLHPVKRLNDAPRCSAKAKTTGRRCKAPAVTGRLVCRMHGARGGAPCGKNNGMWRHGGRSAEQAASRREISDLIRLASEQMDELK